MPEKNEKQLESMESVRWVEREFWAWNGRENE